MSRVHRFRDFPEYQEFRKMLKDAGEDPNVIAEIGETEGDSLDLVETIMAYEEAFDQPRKRKGVRH